MKEAPSFAASSRPRRALLVGVRLPSQLDGEVESCLEELGALAHAYEMEVVGQVVQRLDRPCPATWIGKGKVEEVREEVVAKGVDRVIFDDELSAAQVRNLEKKWGCAVWDRNLLILGIFAARARTAQAKTQVTLAQYEYLLPRLVGMWSHHSRQKGGAGMKGPGETELETDKRFVQKRIYCLKRKLAAIEKQGVVQRKRRWNQVKVALVGYTNAGKSTLMRCLSGEDVLVEDRLFATLGTTVRKVVVRGVPFLLSDTVGFIHKLPHTLIEAFKSTLAEVREADVLLHVVDFSHGDFQRHIEVVHRTLEGIGASGIPSILVLNKGDVVARRRVERGEGLDGAQEKVFFAAEAQRYAHAYGLPAVVCSAVEEGGVEALWSALYEKVVEQYRRIYPYNQAGTLAP